MKQRFLEDLVIKRETHEFSLGCSYCFEHIINLRKTEVTVRMFIGLTI